MGICSLHKSLYAEKTSTNAKLKTEYWRNYAARQYQYGSKMVEQQSSPVASFFCLLHPLLVLPTSSPSLLPSTSAVSVLPRVTALPPYHCIFAGHVIYVAQCRRRRAARQWPGFGAMRLHDGWASSLTGHYCLLLTPISCWLLSSSTAFCIWLLPLAADSYLLSTDCSFLFYVLLLTTITAAAVDASVFNFNLLWCDLQFVFL